MISNTETDYKVSVCVPVYRVHDYVERHVRSLMEQTLDKVQYIFIDDCSPDDSIEIVERTVNDYTERRPHVTILRNDRNMGPGLTRRRAGELATGQFIYFPDSDDWLEHDMLEAMYARATATAADLVICHKYDETDDGSKTVTPVDINLTVDQWRERIIQRNNIYLGLATTLIRLSTYRLAIASCPKERLYAMEDYMLSVKLHFSSRLTSCIEQPFYHVMVSNPVSLSKTNQKHILDKIIVAQNLYEFLLSRNDNEKYISKTIHFKVEAKAELLSSHVTWNPERWRSLWPELSNPRLLTGSGFMTKTKRQIIKLVNNKHDKVAYYLMQLTNVLHKIFIKIR